MKAFIFLTEEGYTFQPGSIAAEPDVDNLQVLGFGKGVDLEDAFENYLAENEWIGRTSFREVMCSELKEANYERYVTFQLIPAQV